MLKEDKYVNHAKKTRLRAVLIWNYLQMKNLSYILEVCPRV